MKIGSTIEFALLVKVRTGAISKGLAAAKRTVKRVMERIRIKAESKKAQCIGEGI